MIKLSNLINEIKINKPGGSRVYVSEPYVELFKVENFPIIYDTEYLSKDIHFFLKDKANPEFGQIINKIINYIQGYDDPTFNFTGNFSSRNEIIYIYIDGEENYTIVDSLNQFGRDYETEEGWGVENWKII
jgi:hypothetical protein